MICVMWLNRVTGRPVGYRWAEDIGEALEIDEEFDDRDVKVRFLSGESKETIRRNWAHYFKVKE